MKRYLYLTFILMLLIFIPSCGMGRSVATSAQSYPAGVNANKTVTEQNEQRISVLAAGDIMFHMPQVKSAYAGEKYDFRPFFEDIKPEIEASDISVANLETTINPKRKVSSYPRFNSPVQVLEAIKDTGFDVLVTANNHCMDTGSEGVISTVNMVKRYGIIPVGTGEKNNKKYNVVDKNGIRVGFLAYTSTTNGIKAPLGMVNYTDINRIKSDIKEIKKQCDFVIVYVHTGTEYYREVEEQQKKLFRQIADLGADCVLGSHPHVARPSEVYNSTKGSKVFICYSLGNFISNQNNKYTDIGIMTKLSILKQENTCRLDRVDVIPVYRLRYYEGNKKVYKVVLCSKINDYKISNSERAYVSRAYGDITAQISNLALHNN